MNNSKPQTPAIPDLPDEIPPKSDNPSPSKGLRAFMPQTADEVLDKFFVLRAATPDDSLEEIKRRSELGTAGTELKTALLAGLLEKMPDHVKLKMRKYHHQTQIDGYNQGIADAVEAIKEYFGITGIPIPKEEYVKLAGEVKEIKDKEYFGSDV